MAATVIVKGGAKYPKFLYAWDAGFDAYTVIIANRPWAERNPTRVRAFCNFGRYHAIEAEDDVTAYMEFPNGATGVALAELALLGRRLLAAP